jgi:glycolate oxidase FAD binding subunit
MAQPVSDPVLTRWVDAVQTARSERRSLALQGGGTKSFYGPPGRGEPFDLRALRGISSYEPSELVVTVRAGTPLAELEAALAEKGQCLPFEPPRFGVDSQAGTVGGMVAAGLAGPARASSGGVRDFVLGATLLNGRGEVLSFGGQVMKNVAGYDVSRLLAGSMGVLGIVCEVSLKVLPQPVATRTLHFERDEATALQQLNRWAGQPLPLSASAWWRGALVLRLAGARAAVEAAAQRLVSQDGGHPIEPAAAEAFWTGLRDHTDEFFRDSAASLQGGASLWRVSVPSTAAPLALQGDQLIEWGGAQRWWVTRDAAARVREVAAAAGGHACVFRAGGAAQDRVVAGAGHVLAPLSPTLLALHRRLKQAFDPDAVFNPGRLHPDL